MGHLSACTDRVATEFWLRLSASWCANRQWHLPGTGYIFCYFSVLLQKQRADAVSEGICQCQVIIFASSSPTWWLVEKLVRDGGPVCALPSSSPLFFSPVRPQSRAE